MTKLFPVEQVDREDTISLTKALVGDNYGKDKLQGCREGKEDHTVMVQWFAKRRLKLEGKLDEERM